MHALIAALLTLIVALNTLIAVLLAQIVALLAGVALSNTPGFKSLHLLFELLDFRRQLAHLDFKFFFTHCFYP
ncbi:hypothetical protein [Endozoicomonas lisbonensis]|uniref:hypothetical protein n=1 Tax=Endozoicomonas lisbonensis TaxID=3120522 RepID=UPI0033967A5C